MTIEQHAEAAVREYWDAANRADGTGKAMTHYIASHIAAAIDDATAPLKGTIAAQDERERLAGERCGVPYEQHGCDWPEWVSDEVLKLRERIAELEGLGPLIDKAVRVGISLGCSIGPVHTDVQEILDTRLSEINAILKGGAS